MANDVAPGQFDDESDESDSARATAASRDATDGDPAADSDDTNAAPGAKELLPLGNETDPLVIRSLDFIGGMAKVAGWRPLTDLPEIAFAGRSNVGKSSLLNRLVRRKSIARVSKTPGRTREINFFNVNGRFTLVDLPGYGYARIAKERKAEWRPLIEGYLQSSTQLRGIVQLLDIRREPTEDDLGMLDFLADLGVPTVVVVTKVDKVPRAEAATRANEIGLRLGLDPEQVIPFSSVTGAGRDELAAAVATIVTQPNWRTE